MLQRPSDKDLASELGSAEDIWKQLIASIIERVGPVDEEWKPSKASFGWLCLLKQKKRTLVYLTPDKEFVTVSIVLGERAVAIALESRLPEAIKGLIKEARPYAEGRGIRFVLKSKTEVQVVADLIAIKIAPK